MSAGTAVISADGRYRYQLSRQIDTRGMLDAGMLNVILLNPSTATAEQEDQTIRRCIGYAQAWGYGTLVVTNLFALRSRLPAALKLAADPIGPDNDVHLTKVARRADLVLVAWGAVGGYLGRDMVVFRLVSSFDVPVRCLGRTKRGYPLHPLYCRADLQPVPFGLR